MTQVDCCIHGSLIGVLCTWMHTVCIHMEVCVDMYMGMCLYNCRYPEHNARACKHLAVCVYVKATSTTWNTKLRKDMLPNHDKKE